RAIFKPYDVVRPAADGDEVGRAVAVEVAAAEVLGGRGGVEDGAGPGAAVEVVGQDARAGAAVAGEDLVGAVAVDVGDPEGVAVAQGVVDDRPRAERLPARTGGPVGPVNGDLCAVPGLDRGEEPGAVGELADVNL